MKLTRKTFMNKGAEVSAKRAVDFNKLADCLGLTEEENEVDVTEAMFDSAVSNVTSEAAESEHSSLVTMLETTMFCIAMSDALFGKGENNETEKADS